MRTLRADLRERIVAARAQGHSAQELARLFGVSKRSVERFWAMQQTIGSLAPKPRGGYRKSRLEKHDATLRRWIKARPDLTLAELSQRIARELGVQLGTTALWHRLDRLGLSYKKNAARRGARPSGAAGRPPALAPGAKKLGRPPAPLSR
jgi:transposase